jgi:hypothetical protein
MNECPICHVYFKSVAQHIAQTSFCRDILTTGRIGGHQNPSRANVESTMKDNESPLDVGNDQYDHPVENNQQHYHNGDIYSTVNPSGGRAVEESDEQVDDLNIDHQSISDPPPHETAADIEHIPTKYFTSNFVLSPQIRGYIGLLVLADKYSIPKRGWEDLCKLLNSLQEMKFKKKRVQMVTLVWGNILQMKWTKRIPTIAVVAIAPVTWKFDALGSNLLSYAK